MPKDEERMSEAELADYHYQHRDDPEMDGEPVEMSIARPLSVTVSFRLPQEEAATIRAAADESGLSQSEWIRTACAQAALDGAAPGPRPGSLSTEQAREVLDALVAAESIIRPAAKAG